MCGGERAMSTSTDDVRSIGHSTAREPTGFPPNRYDAILLVIPLAFVVALFFSVLAGIPIEIALSIAAVVGAVAIADGAYRNPPTER